jgi:hypothetical protein
MGGGWWEMGARRWVVGEDIPGGEKNTQHETARNNTKCWIYRRLSQQVRWSGGEGQRGRVRGEEESMCLVVCLVMGMGVCVH